MNDLHDRSSSSKSDDERQRTIIVHRTIYKLRAATKLIKSMRLTEASSLLVLRIDLIGLLPLPSLPPPFLLSLLFHKYIYVRIYSTAGIRSRVTSKRSKWENLAAGHRLPASFPFWGLLERCAHFFPRSTRSSVDWKPVASLDAQHGVASCHHWYCAITRFPGVSTTSFEAEWLARRYIKS